MAGELVEGKRTFIARKGEPYELPEGHSAEWAEYQGVRTIELASPHAGGQYSVETVEEDDDRVIVRVGDFIDWYGPGGVADDGGQLPEPPGYPFMD